MPMSLGKKNMEKKSSGKKQFIDILLTKNMYRWKKLIWIHIRMVYNYLFIKRQ